MKLALPVIVLMLLFRIYLATDAIPNVGHTKITFYQREASAKEIKRMAAGRKVGFYNNYAATSNYIFYTGDTAIHLSTPGYRYCQYDLWDEEYSASGEPVFAIQSKHMNPPNLTSMVTGELKGYIIIQEFQPLTGLEIINYDFKDQDENLVFEVDLHNTGQNPVYTNHVSEPVLAFMQNNIEIASIPLHHSETDVIGIKEQASIKFSISKNTIDPGTPFVLYTRTKEDIRGDLVAVQP